MRMLLCAVLMSWCLDSSAAEIGPSDLAIILPPKGPSKIEAVEPYFSSRWLDRIDEVLRNTTVEDAFTTESRRRDWRLVSLRIAPCQPLLPYVSTQNDTLCEAEIRLVWQPIQGIRERGLETYYADDRAIHALYRVDGSRQLSAERAALYRSLQVNSRSLSKSDRTTYDALHREVVQDLKSALLALRGSRLDDDYQTIAERPEFQSSSSARNFIGRLQNFLKHYSSFDHLKELTAFSLPAGRVPPLLDDWVFAAFVPSDSGLDLQSKNITLQSRKDGRVLFDYGPFMNGTMRFDDQRLHQALAHLPQEDVKEIESAVILAPRAPQSKKDAIANRLATHVAHTSCVSCHKLKDPPFDFHNLSYFEDRTLVPSPRVEQDVAIDLDWLRSH